MLTEPNCKNMIRGNFLDSDDRMAGIVTVDDVLAHYLPQIIKIGGLLWIWLLLKRSLIN